jgi:hypothetical protein
VLGLWKEGQANMTRQQQSNTAFDDMEATATLAVETVPTNMINVHTLTLAKFSFK